jgi:hypothetical protein
MGLRLFFLPYFPGATFIPDSRVRSGFEFHFCLKVILRYIIAPSCGKLVILLHNST